MALQKSNFGGNIYQATKGAKIPEAKEIDLTEFNKVHEAKVAKRKKFDDALNALKSSDLPLKYMSVLQENIDKIDKSVNEGLSVDSPEYHNGILGLENMALNMGANVNRVKAGIEAQQKDPSSWSSVHQNDAGNVQDGTSEEGLVRQWDILNTASEAGTTAEEAMMDSDKHWKNNFTAALKYDTEKMTTEGQAFFDANYKHSFDIAMSDVDGVYNAEEYRILEGKARDNVINEFIHSNPKYFEAVHRNEGTANTAEANKKLADALIPKIGFDAKTGRTESSSKRYLNYKKASGYGKTNDEEPPEFGLIDYEAEGKLGDIYQEKLVKPFNTTISGQTMLIEDVVFDPKSKNFYVRGIVPENEKGTVTKDIIKSKPSGFFEEDEDGNKVPIMQDEKVGTEVDWKETKTKNSRKTVSEKDLVTIYQEMGFTQEASIARIKEMQNKPKDKKAELTANQEESIKATMKENPDYSREEVIKALGY